jgi:hypothetical protein
MMSEIKFPYKLVGIIAAIFIIIIVTTMNIGINDAGKRTVVQYPNGELYVKFSPGWYTKWFGSTEEYSDLITFDFDKLEAEGDGATLDQMGIAVRYQDGGTGTIYGKSRYSLPTDEPTMIKLHKSFRSNNGVAYKLIKSVTEEGENLTAGLMTSEDAYATKRGIFTQWSHEQISFGKYQTELRTISDTDEITGKTLEKIIPEIKYGKDGRPLQFVSDLKIYGITVSGYQITDWDFEKKTLDQISNKRDATMAIITAKANAERAKQDAITAEEQGKANVMTAKYEKEVEKQRAVVDAEKTKEVAVIEARQKVDVAEQIKKETEQKKFAAGEYKQEQILRGEGDATYKRKVLEADGALEQKIAAFITIQGKYAEEFGKQKWVPEIMMGGTNNTNGNEAANLINLLTAKSLKDLGLDMTIPKGSMVGK